MNRTSARIGLASFTLAAVSAAMMSGWRAGDPPELPAVVQWMGNHSSITKPRTVLISDAATWERVYAEHMGSLLEHAPTSAAYIPEVDFARYSVVCVFGGARINTSGYRLVSIADLPEVQRLRYDAVQYQTMSLDGKDPGNSCEPFGMFVIPRPRRTLVLEEDVNGLIGAAPKWKEQCRIEPPK